MVKKDVFDVYGLLPVPNVCDQTLREVVSFPSFSLAHVIVGPGSVSLLHEHKMMFEVYFVLAGEGVLFCGSDAYSVQKGSCHFIDRSRPHKLWNSDDGPLEHLVVAAPPFGPGDVFVLEGSSADEECYMYFSCSPSARFEFVSDDGAFVSELLSRSLRDLAGVGLAFGRLLKDGSASRHFHSRTDELYYVLSGVGRVHLDADSYDVGRGSVVRIPANVVHGLENKGDSDLEVLCISGPPFDDDDFIKVL